MSAPAKIAVLGSLNVDSTYGVPHLPVPGETITSTGVSVSRGGKGANQAVAAHRAGGKVQMIGCVGSDDAGENYLAAMRGEGIGVEGVLTSDKVATGSAIIYVDALGENTIVVDPGANHALTQEQVESSRALIEAVDVLLLQLECPLECVRLASEIATESNVKVVVNPSPWIEEFAQSGVLFDYLIVNETEAECFLGQSPSLSETWDSSERETAALIITRGANSTLFAKQGDEFREESAISVSPVDTVGAGDSFAGAISVAIAENIALPKAVQFANTAGALATLKHGAQSAIPTRNEIRDAMA